MISAWYFWGNY